MNVAHFPSEESRFMPEMLKKAVTDALKTIVPEGASQDIVSSGVLSTIIVDGSQIGIILDFKENPPKNIPQIRENIESVVLGVDGVTAANVILSALKQQAKAPPTISAGKPAPTPTPLEGVKHVVAVASGKGGVGKSTTSINLAIALQKQGLKVGLMDADIFGPSVPTLVGVDEKPTIQDKVIQPLSAYDIKVMSIGFLIDIDQPVVWRGPRVMGATQQLLKDVAWGPIDVLIVDMPPGTGDVQLSLVQQAKLSGAVIVSTPQDLALIDARKGITMFEKTGVPIMGIIENMTSFICPECGTESEIFGHGGAKETANIVNCDFLGGIPLHMSVRQSADAGKPIVATQEDSPISKAYMKIASSLKQKLNL